MRSDAALIWSFRASAEREASRRFERLSSRLSDVGAERAIVQMALRAASDETRHEQMCAALVEHFGGRFDAAPCGEPPEVAPAGLVLRERVLYEVVALSCITETLSAALLGAMVERATDVRVKETAQRILRDEIDHGRLGWAHLALEQAHGYGRFLGDYLPAMLEGTVSDEVFRDGDLRDASTSRGHEMSLAGVGALGRSDRRNIFVATMRDVVFPGLRRFGVDVGAGERWLADRIA